MRSLVPAACLFVLTPTAVRAQEPPPLVDLPDDKPPPSLVRTEPIDATPPPPPGRGVVHLHLEGGEMFLKRDSGPPVRVFDEKGMHLVMGVVCQAPCEAIVDARANDFVLGGGSTVPDSFSFNLKNERGNLTIHTSPGNYILTTGGALLAGLGGYVLYAGTLLTLSTASLGVPLVSFGTLGAGLVLVGLGGAVLFLSRTTYRITRESTPTIISQ